MNIEEVRNAHISISNATMSVSNAKRYLPSEYQAKLNDIIHQLNVVYLKVAADALALSEEVAHG